MASVDKVQTVLSKISQGHLECSICSNSFRQPKVLSCSHSFCLKCLQELRKRQDSRSTKLLCPSCRQETTVREVADLPDNLLLSALVEEVALQEQLLRGRGSDIRCEACDEKNQAISRCSDCDHFLCLECQRAHGRLAMMKTHKIYTLGQLRSVEIAYKSKPREASPRCGKHPDQFLSIYCNSCEKLLCPICSNADHGEHFLISLAEAFEKCKQDVADLAAKVKQNMKELMNITMNETHKSRTKLDTMFDNTSRKISEKADKEVAKIREEERKLKQEAETIYQDRVQTFDTAEARNSKEVSQAGQMLDEVNRLMSQVNRYVILHLRQKLLKELGQFVSEQQEKVPEQIPFMDFEEGSDERSLGRITQKPTLKPRSFKLERKDLKDKWELKTQIQSFGPAQTRFRWACGVAAFANDEIVVADLTHKQLIHCSPTGVSRTYPTPQRLQIKCANPSCVAVNKGDQLIVLDSTAVMTFNRMYQFLHQFIPGRGPNSKPTCLAVAVDDDNLIAVGYKDAEEISLHKPDGFLIRTLPAPMTVEHLAICKQRLIYTNWDSKKILSVDFNGGVLFSVDTTSSMLRNCGPAGVCCDGEGNIYAAVCGFGSSSGEIHHFGPAGKHTGCVIEGCGFPRGITFTTSGDNLVVAAGDSVRIFHRV